MNILKKLTRRFLEKNPRRTMVTVVGILLSSALITAVANLAESVRYSIIAYYQNTQGNYHYIFEGVLPENLKYFENNPSFEKIGKGCEMGYAVFQESRNGDKPYLYLWGMDAEAFDSASLTLLDGRLPENGTELLISGHAHSNGGMEFGVGDEVTLSMGVRDIGGGYGLRQENPYNEDESFRVQGERCFTIVGVCERPAYTLEPYTAPGYSAFTLMEDSGPGESRRMVFAKCMPGALKKRGQVLEGLEGLADSVSANKNLIRWETMEFSERDLQILYGMAGIAVGIIILTTIFCIRNSFGISLTEKLRLYGMISSVGATRRQRRKLVHYEAFYLGCMGIPLGIAGGALATFLLTKAVDGLIGQLLPGMGLSYVFSLPAMVAGAVLSSVTIYFSAFQSARKAAKISPIEAIRSNDAGNMTGKRHIRSERKALRVPSVVGKLFGVGGMIAYKNLKRSRVKYRVTVVSIAVSVAVFIAISSFVQLGMGTVEGEYGGNGYNLLVRLGLQPGEDRGEEVRRVITQEGVKDYSIVRGQTFLVPKAQIPYTEEYLADLVVLSQPIQEEGECYIMIYSLGEEAYGQYCQEVGIPAEEACKGAIVEGDYHYSVFDEHGEKEYTGRITQLEEGQILSGVRGSDRLPVELAVVAQTHKQPRFRRGGDDNYPVCYVSDAWMDEWQDTGGGTDIVIYLDCADEDAVEAALRADGGLYDCYMVNYGAQVREQRSMYLLLAVFFYGFITVVSLIGVTNIFNTITTNMELRSREFAMLKSLGMTGGEFKRMVRLESIFYSAKALGIGIPLGCAGSFLFYRVMAIGSNLRFPIPWKGIGLSVAAVAALSFGIMGYSMGKINRRSLIETIQNENI